MSGGPVRCPLALAAFDAGATLYLLKYRGGATPSRVSSLPRFWICRHRATLGDGRAVASNREWESCPRLRCARNDADVRSSASKLIRQVLPRQYALREDVHVTAVSFRRAGGDLDVAPFVGVLVARAWSSTSARARPPPSLGAGADVVPPPASCFRRSRRSGREQRHPVARRRSASCACASSAARDVGCAKICTLRRRSAMLRSHGVARACEYPRTAMLRADTAVESATSECTLWNPVMAGIRASGLSRWAVPSRVPPSSMCTRREPPRARRLRRAGWRRRGQGDARLHRRSEALRGRRGGASCCRKRQMARVEQIR